MEIFLFSNTKQKLRVIEFLDEPLHVEEVADRAKELEERNCKRIKN